MPALLKSLKVLATLLVLRYVSVVFCQLDAPGAFSNFAGCAHHTCTWVPWSVHRIFQEGKLSYTVDAKRRHGRRPCCPPR